MRNKSEITALGNAASRIAFPTEDYEFDKFTIRLREVISANFSHAASKAMEYDPHQQNYYWEVEATVGRLGTARVTVTMQMEIYPKRDLLHEFESIKRLYETFEGRCAEMRKAVVALGGEML